MSSQWDNRQQAQQAKTPERGNFTTTKGESIKPNTFIERFLANKSQSASFSLTIKYN